MSFHESTGSSQLTWKHEFILCSAVRFNDIFGKNTFFTKGKMEVDNENVSSYVPLQAKKTLSTKLDFLRRNYRTREWLATATLNWSAIRMLNECLEVWNRWTSTLNCISGYLLPLWSKRHVIRNEWLSEAYKHCWRSLVFHIRVKQLKKLATRRGHNVNGSIVGDLMYQRYAGNWMFKLSVEARNLWNDNADCYSYVSLRWRSCSV